MVERARPMPGTIHVEALRVLLGTAEVLGMPRTRVVEAFDLGTYALDDLDTRVPVELATRLWIELPVALDAPDFGLVAAQTAHAMPLSLGGRLVAASPTLGEGLARLRRFERVMHDVETTSLEVHGDATHIVFDTRGGVPVPRHAMEFAWAYFVLLSRRVTASDVTPRLVTFAHPRPPGDARHRAIFGAPPVFGDATSRLVYATADLARPLTSADPGLVELLEHHASRQLARLPPREPFVAEVHRAVVRALARGDAALEHVAAELGLAPRTLQRRLREHGVRYAAVLDQVRCAIALERIAALDASLAETAFALGFSDQSAFHRAFVRWTGTSPGRYQRARASEPS